jgi:hypothetical protein
MWTTGRVVDCVGASEAARPFDSAKGRPFHFAKGGPALSLSLWLVRFAFLSKLNIPRGDVSGRLCDPRAPRAWAAPPLPLLGYEFKRGV